MLKKMSCVLVFLFICNFAIGEEISPRTNIVQIANEDQFQREVEQFSGTAFVDFYSETCPPCKVLSPLFATWSDNLLGKVKFVKVDVKKNWALAQKFNITGVPTMIVFKNGMPGEKLTGFPDIALYLEDLETKELKVE